MSISINYSSLMGRLNRIQQRYPSEGEQLVKRLSVIGVAEAKRNVPVDTGNLRSSIQLKSITKSPGTIRGGYGTNVFYAPYVEYGHPVYGRGFIPGAFYMGQSAIKVENAVDSEVELFMRRLLG